MGTYSLICHPDTPPLAVTGVGVDWDGDGLVWHVAGAGALVVPPPAPAPARTDGLWRTTCFELFLKKGDGYHEINLSPSGDWAAYAFDGYRRGMAEAMVLPPRISVTPGEAFTLTAVLPAGVAPGATHASLTAVIEETGGHKSYWALNHAAGAPDFHAPSCFILPLGAARGT